MDPRPENWIGLVAFMGLIYYIINYREPRREIVQKDFLDKYLITKQIKEIKISKVKGGGSEVFNHRAEIDTHEGERLYMVLGSQESFLAKLDMVQRQMGLQPNDFVPVKYVND